MDQEFAVQARGLSKRYRIGSMKAPYGRLSETLSNAFNRAILRKNRDVEEEVKDLWALKDVSFDIPHGEVLGIVGRNGAGKTTLLKILSRITEPTEGSAVLNGRVGALLEVGAGLHHELSGRENILLQGAILGMKRTEINSRFDEIVDFAGIGPFIDTPVKRYSSGMFLRLAFSVAAHLEPDILIVDEVLAVGDAAFQKKCLGRMNDVATSGRTVLFVSHNMGAVRSLCQRAILLEKGQITFDGTPADAISNYLSGEGGALEGGQVLWNEGDEETPEEDEIALRGIRLLGPSGNPQEIHEADKPIDVEIFYEIKQAMRGSRWVLSVMTPEGELAFKTTDHDSRPTVEEPGPYRSICTIPGGLLNRRNYVLMLEFHVVNVRVVLKPTEYLTFTIAGPSNHGSDFPEAWDGVLSPRCDWKMERLESRQDLPVEASAYG